MQCFTSSRARSEALLAIWVGAVALPDHYLCIQQLPMRYPRAKLRSASEESLTCRPSCPRASQVLRQAMSFGRPAFASQDPLPRHVLFVRAPEYERDALLAMCFKRVRPGNCHPESPERSESCVIMGR